MYPQGEDRDVSWTVTVMSYYASLVGGVVCAVVSLLWMLHIGEIPFILFPRFFFIGVCMGDWTDDVFCC